MPDQGSVTLIRPDGSRLEGVAPGDVGVLKSLNYQEETPEQHTAEIARQTEDAHWNTPGQKLLTGVEGITSGASLGATDLLFGDAASQRRAEYHPGIRLGTELVGGFYAPVGVLGKAAEALGESKAIRGALRGAVEGAQYGAGSAITNAQLSGDPQSVEAIAAGVGWGGIFGGGLGAIAGKVGEKVEASAMAQRKAVEAAAKEESAVGAISEEKWGAVRGAVTDAKSTLEKAVTDAEEQVGAVGDAEANASTAKAHAEAGTKYAQEGVAYTNSLVDDKFVTTKNPKLRQAVRATQKTLRNVKVAAEVGDFEALTQHLDRYQEQLEAVDTEITKVDPGYAKENPPPIKLEMPIILGKAKRSAEAMSELADMTSISTQLKSFPVTAEGITSLSKAQVDKLGAALDHLGSLKSSELAGVKSAVQGSIDDLMEHLALPIKGSPGTQFRGLWETLKGSGGKAATQATEATAKGAAPWWKKVGKRAAGYAAGYAGEQVAAKLGAKGFSKFIGYEAGKNMLFALMNLKGAVLGHVAGKVADWAPKGVNYVAKIAPRVEPLKTRLDGTIDNVNKNKSDLIVERAKEIRASAMSFSDTVYKGLQPLDKYHPDLAVGLHNLSVEQFKFLIDKLPQDPGHAFSALKTLWKPDDVATEKFSRYYEVFHDPTGVISKALTTHKITPEAAEGLREMWPELYTEFRGRMLEKIASIPSGKLGYNEQVHLGLMLSLPLHSTMSPQFISSQQQMFTERNQKLPMPPQTGAGGTKGGRPGGGSATAAQKVEQH